MRLFFFVGLFLSIKYSEGKLSMEESNDACRDLSIDFKINKSDLNFCADCCDDLNDVESKQAIETRLDLNYFNNVEALKKRETTIYKDIKTCVYQRPLISCVDLCICQTENCILTHLRQVKKLVIAFKCSKKELTRLNSTWKTREIAFSDLESPGKSVEKCWQHLKKNEICLVKSKLVDKPYSWKLEPEKDEEKEQISSENSNEQYSTELNTAAAQQTPSENSSQVKPSSLPKFIIFTLIIFLNKIYFSL